MAGCEDWTELPASIQHWRIQKHYIGLSLFFLTFFFGENFVALPKDVCSFVS